MPREVTAPADVESDGAAEQEKIFDAAERVLG
jgi:hypothetical protein